MTGWERFWLWFSLAFASTVIVVLSSLALWLGDGNAVTSFAGSIAGGLLGGALTVAAGLMAWRVAQVQIGKQQETLDLITSEHALRTARVLNFMLHDLDRLNDTVVRVQEDLYRHVGSASAEQVAWNIALPRLHSIQAGLSDVDFWRADADVQDAAHYIQGIVDTHNEARELWFAADCTNRLKLVDRLSSRVEQLQIRITDQLKMLRGHRDHRVTAH